MSKQVSHETIYRSIYVLPRGELKKALIGCLRQAKRRRGLDRRTRNRGAIFDPPSIHERPLVVEEIHEKPAIGSALWHGRKSKRISDASVQILALPFPVALAAEKIVHLLRRGNFRLEIGRGATVV